MNKQKKIPDGKLLTMQRKAQRAEIEELEMKARYWKAQFEIRDYTLRAEAIQPAYEEYLIKEKEKNAELKKQYEEMRQKLQQQGVDMAPIPIPDQDSLMDVEITQEILDMNPGMVEEGLKIGDIIQVPKETDLTPEEEEEAKNEFEAGPGVYADGSQGGA